MTLHSVPLVYQPLWPHPRPISRLIGAREWLLVLAGVLSVLFGLGVLIFLGTGALALIWLIAIYAVAIGIVMIMLALRLRAHRSSMSTTVPQGGV